MLVLDVKKLSIALLSLCALSRASAQPSAQTARAIRISGRAPSIDGRLTEDLWKRMPSVDTLVQQRPIEGAAASERTEIFFAFDDAALYVAARLHRAEPERVSRTVTRRDAQGNAETLTIYLDTQLDRRTAVSFAVSAAGVRSDTRLTRDEEGGGRESQFDPVWSAAATLDSTGWSAEMRIPFSQLRFSSKQEQAWGLQIGRWLPDKNEELRWVMIPPRENGFISRFGTLTGLGSIVSARPIEVLPYFAGDASRRATASAADPFKDPFDGRAGLDAKFGIGSSVTVDATLNPDFGQVEADPAEVNLSAFETFFDERRPFFVEGAEMLRGSGPQYFYSRRVGAPPHGSISGDFVDRPTSSTILGAAKLTGRLASRLSLGGLLAVTGAEEARGFSVDSGHYASLVEPRTAYGVFRAQQEVGAQQSTVGATIATMRRDLSNSPYLTSILAQNAISGGADFHQRWQQGRYALTGFLGGSYVSGDTAAVARVQRSSARFFQRPDAPAGRYDPTRTSLSGFAASLRADKDAGRHILWGVQVATESPGFELNDVGRIQSSDDIEYNADIQIRETIPSRFLRNWRFGFETRRGWNYEGAQQQHEWTQTINLGFLNFVGLNVRTTRVLSNMSDNLTRGGPLMRTAQGIRQELQLNGPNGSRTGWRLRGTWARDEFGGHAESISGGVTLRPAPRWQFSIDPNYSASLDSRQYVTSLSEGSSRTFDRRYVFAFIDRTTLSTRFRLNYALSPNMTMEGYAEPFLASGRYSRFGELAAPRESAIREYGHDGTTLTADRSGTLTVTDGGKTFSLSNRDFYVRSFRSNFVLRWEWRSGSTLFFVWQQNRRTEDGNGHHVQLDDLFSSRRAPGDNFVSVKMTYWLTLGQ